MFLGLLLKRDRLNPGRPLIRPSADRQTCNNRIAFEFV
jgi:hypothetical protein